MHYFATNSGNFAKDLNKVKCRAKIKFLQKRIETIQKRMCSPPLQFFRLYGNKKFLEEGIFAGTIFCELEFHYKNRENFCLAKISRYIFAKSRLLATVIKQGRGKLKNDGEAMVSAH